MLKEKLDKIITAVGGAKVKKHWLRIGLWFRPASLHYRQIIGL
jgi:hypothetical protein